MSELSDFINDDLYPALFSRIGDAFPEMSFKKVGSKWCSPKKLNGSDSSPRRNDKTVITSKVPHRALEQGGGSVDLVSLFLDMNRNTCSSNIDAIKALAKICNLEVPPMQDSESYRIYKEKQDALEKFAQQMQKDLLSDGGKAIHDYLTTQRGYSDDFIEFAQFGYCSPETANSLRPLFTGKNKEGQEVCYIPNGTGTKYTLAIPYRTGNHIAGFVFRTISGDVTPKYKDAFISAKASKSYHLFGLTGLKLTGDREKDKDIVVVEGEIDALRAQFAGLDNVVAASGGYLSDDALQEAGRRGVKRITLLLDTEEKEESKKEIDKKISKAITAISNNGIYPLVASFPSTGKKVDADSFLVNHTGEELAEIVNSALSGPIYLFRKIVDNAAEKHDGDELVTFRDLNELKSQTIQLANMPFVLPTDRDTIFTEFSLGTGEYITKESLQEEADREKIAQDIADQKKETLSTIKEALSLANSDKTIEALDLLQNRIEPLRKKNREAELNKLLLITSREERRKRLADKPEAIETGFTVYLDGLEIPFRLQSAALTYVCAPTSHGKSAMLQNLALNVATNGTEGTVLYFTLEESEDDIMKKMINIYQGQTLTAKTAKHNNMESITEYFRSGSIQFIRKDSLENFLSKVDEFDEIMDNGTLRLFGPKGNRDIDELSEKVTFLCSKLKVKAVFIDYIQLMQKKSYKGSDKKGVMGYICNDLIDLSTTCKIPIVLGAQVNRQEALSPADLSPQCIADAAEIENSANTILLMWNSGKKPRPNSSYYNNKGKKRELTPEGERIEAMGLNIGTYGKMYIKLGKYRISQPDGEAVLNFDGNTGKFSQDPIVPLIHASSSSTKSDNVTAKEM